MGRREEVSKDPTYIQNFRVKTVYQEKYLGVKIVSRTRNKNIKLNSEKLILNVQFPQLWFYHQLHRTLGL